MAYANVDDSLTWHIPNYGVKSPEVVEIAIPTTKTFVAMDFSEVLHGSVGISTVAAPTEIDSKTITFADQAVDPSNKIVSFSVAGMVAGDYNVRVEVTKSEETNNEASGIGTLRVI